MKTKTIGIHTLAGAMLAAAAMAPSAHAAGPVLKRVAPVAQPAAATADSARLIIKYRPGTATSNNRMMKQAVVETAAARASLRMPAASRAAASMPLRAQHVRAMAAGGDVVKLSRRLNQTELGALIQQIKADPSVQSVQVDRMLRPAAWVDDTHYANQWNFSAYTPGGIDAETAWDTSTGEGVVVAVLDTGIVPHPDLDANMLEGYDFITDSFVSRRPTNERVPGAFDYGDWSENWDECYEYSPPTSSSWHGSHVAGTVAEVSNNALGVAGVAHKAKVLPVRVLGRCGGYGSDIADAIVWASGGTVPGVPANTNPAEVINLSLGGGGTCDTMTQDAINGAVARGATVVVAAGNSNWLASEFTPASCQNVITVGANRYNGGKASYSNYGAAVDIAAPGGGGDVDGVPNGFILQAGNSSATAPDLDPATGPAYWYNAGTSMSAPHVAAVAAMVQSVVATPLTPSQMEALLKKTARPFPVAIPTTSPIGVGILNANRALAKALEPPCDPQVQTCIEATQVFNKINVPGLGGVTDSETLYSFDAEAGKVLSILTFGGVGDVGVYVSFDAEPTTTAYQFRSVRNGNSETVRIIAPQTGTYYIKLVGTRSYSGVTLSVRQ